MSCTFAIAALSMSALGQRPPLAKNSENGFYCAFFARAQRAIPLANGPGSDASMRAAIIAREPSHAQFFEVQFTFYRVQNRVVNFAVAMQTDKVRASTGHGQKRRLEMRFANRA